VGPGNEPMTGPQESHLRTPSREARAEVPADLNKAEASKKIDELQAETGRSNSVRGSASQRRPTFIPCADSDSPSPARRSP
jgi:Protein of unknown function (DUF3072)